MNARRTTSGSDPVAAAQRAAEVIAALGRSPDDLAAVRAVLADHGEPVPIDAADLPGLRAAADAVRAVFAADDTDAAAHAVNTLFTRYATAPRLTGHDGTGWHLHVDAADDGEWGGWFGASSALALSVLLASRQRPPGALCAAPDCGAPFLIHGGGTPRRYCSTRCATRVRVARHRGGA